MLQLVDVGNKSIADYASLASRGVMDEIRRLAEPLAGKRVVHLSATAFGGGVAEINYALVPLMEDVGLEVEWRIIKGDDEFFGVTKAIHNALQGDPHGLTKAQEEIFRRYNAMNAEEFEDDYDFVLVHDPQPAAMIEHFPDSAASWIWRCHIDLSSPNRSVLDFLAPSLERYDASIFHMPQYVPQQVQLREAFIWPPAIDPLTPKNMALSGEDAAYVVDQFGIHLERPLLTQISRFDPWKDPLGVIDAYKLVKQTHPNVQLALVGSMAHDDPEGWDYYNRTVAHAAGDPDIFILSNLNNIGSVEVNAFQVHSAAVIQKSIREGFGLTVTEALWKGRPMVGGRAGGIPRRSERARRDGSSIPRWSAPTRAARSSTALPRQRVAGGAGRRTCVSASSCRACCVTGWRCSTASTATMSAKPGSSPSRRLPRPGRALGSRPMVERRRLIVVSNRGPASFSLDEDGKRVARRGGGGLVTALRSLVAHHDVTWIASAMTDEDRAVFAETGGEAVEELARDGSPYRLRLVAHDPAAYDWFYNVVANPTLWFLQHYLWGLAYAPDIDQGLYHAWDEGYVPVNRAFADAALAELEGQPDAAVFFHDYHLYLAPRYVREARPDAPLAHFVHIPWPGPNIWRVLPEPIRRRSMRACSQTTCSASTRTDGAGASCGRAATCSAPTATSSRALSGTETAEPSSPHGRSRSTPTSSRRLP